MKPLVNFYDGEPWFDNPQLVIANPKRRKKTMTKRRTRRGRKNAPRRVRRNFYSAGMLSNRPRRKARRSRKRRTMRSNVYMPMNPRKRRSSRRHAFRRNPGRSFLGFTMPPMAEVLFATAGLIGPNLVSGKILEFLPASWKVGADGKPNQLTMWATKLLSVVLPAWAIRRFIGTRESNSFLVGGLAGLTLDGIKTFAPGIIPGIGSQPLLGAYFDQPRQVLPFPRSNGKLPQMIADTPDRLSPSARF